jgi:hypothetical protein
MRFLFWPAWDSNNEDRAVKAVAKIRDEDKLARIAKEARSWEARRVAVERVTDQSVLADVARNDKIYFVRLAATGRLTDQSILTAIARNDKEHISVRIAASHRLVNYDLEEDLLTYIIYTLGGVLKNSDDKQEREKAGEALLSWYRRYRKDKHGREIRMYEGKHGYSDHTDEHNDYHTEQDDCYMHICNPTTIDVHTDVHTDEHRDDLYTFNPEEA